MIEEGNRDDSGDRVASRSVEGKQCNMAYDRVNVQIVVEISRLEGLLSIRLCTWSLVRTDSIIYLILTEGFDAYKLYKSFWRGYC